MSKPIKKQWSLKKLITKASDVNLNTAIALSKSLKDLEKQNRIKTKELNSTPFNLMKDPGEVKKILDLRLSNSILQPYQINLIDIVPHHTCRLWDKASLYCDIKPGDLSYDNINLSELMDYYVSALIPYISPSTYREGDKMLNVSKIVGREKSFIYSEEYEKSQNDSFHQPLSKEATNNSFICTEKEDSIQLLSIRDLSEESTQLPSVPDLRNSDLLSENNFNLNQCKFFKMFNNDKFSDLVLFLKSETVLYLHKFVLTAWNCSGEILKESQQCILNIEDVIVIKLLKHLYSDGKFNIDDIIDSEDCLNLCKILGLNWSLLNKQILIVPFDQPVKIFDSNSCDIIDKNVILSSSLECSDEKKISLSPKSVENICDISMEHDNFSNCLDSDNLIQSTPNHFLPKNIGEEDVNRTQNLSDKDLFESFDYSINLTFEAISNGSIQKIEEPQNKYSLYRKLCSLTNESYLTNCPNTVSKDSQNIISKSPGKENYKESFHKKFNSPSASKKEKPKLINDFDVEQNFPSLTFCKLPEVNKLNKEKNISKVNFNNENNLKEEHNEIFMENSPLPLRQRLALKTQNYDTKVFVINISSDEDDSKSILSNNKIDNHNSDNIEKIVIKSKRPKGKSKAETIQTNKELSKKPKVVKEKHSKKRKSEKILSEYLTPTKQKPLVEPFTPVPDFSAMPTPVIKEKCIKFGIKGNLPKNHSIKILEKVHIYERQINKNDTSGSSSCSESVNSSLKEFNQTESNDSKDGIVSDDLNDNTELFMFLKTAYFKDILTYKPIDIRKVLSELKENGIKTSLKKLNDYFDNQCILCSVDEINKKDKKFNRPIKASKMIL